MTQTELYSGKAPADFGNMVGCKESINMKYYFLAINQPSNPLFDTLIGICVNKKCSAEDITK